MTRSNVQSEISGKVWKVEAGVGARLEAEEPIVVLESMKMEIPVPAPHACTVVEVLVAEGDAVDEGQVVAVVEA